MEKIARNNDIKRIAILMATYNGENFLRTQIDSLLAQSYSNWTLYIHDDGSTDQTLDILHNYTSQHPNIIVLEYPPLKSATKNFLSLLDRVEADYYLFCDQDDYWLPNKIEKELIRMQDIESTHPNKPIIVFSDLSVTDESLRITDKSMWEVSGIRPELLTNFDLGGAFEFVTGCTMLFNQEAKNSLNVSAQKATVHDLWLSLCVLRAGGIISAIAVPLVLYRQHTKNTLGASKWASKTMAYKVCHLKRIIKHDYHHWQMLQTLGYGSFAKYYYYKYVYRRIHK
jgi:rhamnosyltransferase